MATVVKVLGQAAPAATTDGTLYTCPAGGQTIVSSLIVCNRGSDTTIRIRVNIDGAAATNAAYLFYDAAVPANGTVSLVAGITLDAADTITVYSTSGNVSFNAYGQETT